MGFYGISVIILRLNTFYLIAQFNDTIVPIPFWFIVKGISFSTGEMDRKNDNPVTTVLMIPKAVLSPDFFLYLFIFTRNAVSSELEYTELNSVINSLKASAASS